MTTLLLLVSDLFPAPRSTISPSQPDVCLHDQVSLIFQRCCDLPSIKGRFLKALPTRSQDLFLECFTRYQGPRKNLENQVKLIRNAINEIDQLAAWRIQASEEIREKSERARGMDHLIEQFQLNNGFATKAQWKEIDRTLAKDEKSPLYNQLSQRHNDLISQRDALDEAVSALKRQMELNDARVRLAEGMTDHLRSTNAELTRQMNQGLEDFMEILEADLTSNQERKSLQDKMRLILREE